ncbi:MAG: hypothetical protein OEY99_06845 [Aigarchaeota archaeon]|nr:hypothetical protein [Aigarchaeota archaeon]
MIEVLLAARSILRRRDLSDRGHAAAFAALSGEKEKTTDTQLNITLRV